MTSLQEHIEGVASLIADYRQDDIVKPDQEYVAQWLHQFDAPIRTPFIAEIHHVLSKTYLSRSTFERFYRNQIEHEKLTGGNPATYWRRANFFRIQSQGTSQTDVLKIFGKALKETLGIRLSQCGGGSDFIYLDDILFSGGRVGSDLEQWIADEAPNSAVVIVLLMATHEFGEYATKKRLTKAAQAANKQITFQIWRSMNLENRKAYRNDSDVLWPTSLPPEAADYHQGKYPFEPRSPGGNSNLFSSEAAREILEDGFLSAGLRIRSFCHNPSPSLRPLGFGPFGVGFGSLFVTYRNCPNNAPLALWWGNPEADSSHPFSKWQPLVPRKTYGPFDNIEL